MEFLLLSVHNITTKSIHLIDLGYLDFIILLSLAGYSTNGGTVAKFYK
jgi:hypothetical protein